MYNAIDVLTVGRLKKLPTVVFGKIKSAVTVIATSKFVSIVK